MNSAIITDAAAVSQAWIRAMEDATSCIILQQQQQQQQHQYRNNHNHHSEEDQVIDNAESSLRYLIKLEHFLKQQSQSQQQQQQQHNNQEDHQQEQEEQQCWDEPPIVRPPSFYDGDDNDEYEFEYEYDQEQEQVLDGYNNLGGYSNYNPQQQQHRQQWGGVGGLNNNNNNDAGVLSVRRLLIRLYTCQSDLLQHLAYLAVKTTARPVPLWLDGANYCSKAVDTIRTALQLADTEIVKLLLMNNNNYSHQQSHNNNMATNLVLYRQNLERDADIVSVCVQHLVRQKDKFCYDAQREHDRLQRKLQPQWESRDEVRHRMGDEKWLNNPHPRRDYARQRQQDEKLYYQLQNAIDTLLELDTQQLQINTEELRQKLLLSSSSSSIGHNSNKQQLQQQQNQNQNQNRYNGIRPSDYSQRVSWEEYPDPTLCDGQWTFTGSHEPSRVEFFTSSSMGGGNGQQQQVVLLDWYYTTGTIKTSLYHPRQQKHTQLFLSSKMISPTLYREILNNPRVHTSKRYHQQKRNTNNNTSNNNRSSSSSSSRNNSSGRNNNNNNNKPKSNKNKNKKNYYYNNK